ncbi:MAG: SWIM zinc finger family protein [Bacteroidetes bacterium]|nr:SWIM zinc finger family protein [Bacteroidota bacterium]MBU1721140.1 SWIM zinc finger family protein [Bacteroidota bacterium]
MNLNDFKSLIPPAIFERGNDYFTNGNITDLQQLRSGEWIASVEGNYDDYSVVVNLDKNNNIDNYQCNCPFDRAICKHVTAVLLAIKKEQAAPTPSKRNNPPEWECVIMNTPEKELRDFLLNFAKKDRDFQHDLVVHLSASSKKINPEKYKAIVSRIFNEAGGRNGFIDYRNMFSTMRKINDLLSRAQEHISKGNLHEAFSIVSAVAPECIIAIEDMDDSNGECGGAINDSFDISSEILCACKDVELSNTIFDWLFVQIQNPAYSDYGCNEALDAVFWDWVNTPTRIAIAYQFIDEQLGRVKTETGWCSRYKATKYLKYKIQLLSSEGRLDEVNKIIEDNLHLNEFREMRIDEALSRNDIDGAIQHIHEGIAQAKNDNHPGIVHQLKNKLLDLYKSQNDSKNTRLLSKELFLENKNSITYYKVYKGTFSDDEWVGSCAEMIDELQKTAKGNYWGTKFQSELAAIYIEESMWNKLFGMVKQANNIELVERYSKYLVPHFSDELVILYRDAVFQYAGNTGRNIYISLVRYLKNMAELPGGKSVAKNLMLEILEKYKSRPAMKDEFKQLGW